MKLVSRIAWRYFKAKKSIQAINIISRISLGAIAVSMAALIILFSVFNGLDSVIKDFYTFVNPQIKITATKGKFFKVPTQKMKEIREIKGVAALAGTIQDMALLSNGSDQRAGIIKGVNNDWFGVVKGVDSAMLEGEAQWKEGETRPPGILGLGASNQLRVDVTNPFSELIVYYPKSEIQGSLNPENSLSSLIVQPQGLIRIPQLMDGQAMLIPLKLAQQLFEKEGQLEAIEIRLTDYGQVSRIQKEIKKIMGDDFEVANRFEQNKTLFMVMSSEKWMIYAILCFVLLIASFNLTGSLYMLVWEKKRDISILKSMGLEDNSVKKIFLSEGLLIALSGGILGIIIGVLVCLGQIYFGWLKLPEGFAVPTYPVAFKATDFLLAIGTVLVIGFLAALYPAKKAAKQSVYLREE